MKKAHKDTARYWVLIIMISAVILATMAITVGH